MKLSHSSSSSRVPALMSPSVVSPVKRAPVPPPRIITAPAPLASPSSSSSSSYHHDLQPNHTANNVSTDISLRSSSDSGFANESQQLPPPAPEVDYSDDSDSFKWVHSLLTWGTTCYLTLQLHLLIYYIIGDESSDIAQCFYNYEIQSYWVMD